MSWVRARNAREECTRVKPSVRVHDRMPTNLRSGRLERTELAVIHEAACIRVAGGKRYEYVTCTGVMLGIRGGLPHGW